MSLPKARSFSLKTPTLDRVHHPLSGLLTVGFWHCGKGFEYSSAEQLPELQLRKSGEKEPRLTLELWRFCRKCSRQASWCSCATSHCRTIDRSGIFGDMVCGSSSETNGSRLPFCHSHAASCHCPMLLRPLTILVFLCGSQLRLM